jgi:4-amino-4-deoxy-L-arabinose transferase-like glycosyltransferase
VNKFFLNPASCAIIFLLLLTLPWAISPIIFQHNIELDSVEQLVWSSSAELGYYKHPPFPTWLTIVFTAVFGKSAVSLFALSGLTIFTMLSPTPAMLATAVVSTCTYFTARSLMFNHNTVQLAAVAASIYCLIKALDTLQWRYWGLFAVACAIGFLTKYSMLIHFAAFACYLLLSRRLLQKVIMLRLVFAIVIFVCLIAPHVYWLSQTPVNPISYARALIAPLQAVNRWDNLGSFISIQIMRLLPLLVCALIVRFMLLRNTTIKSAGSVFNVLTKDNKLFVLTLALFPCMSVVILATAFNFNLVTHWATTFFILFGFLCLTIIPNINLERNKNKIACMFISIQVVSALFYGIARGPLASYLGRDGRSTYPAVQLSQDIDLIWRSNSPHPLKLLVSDLWTGGNISTQLMSKPLLLIENQIEFSPWVHQSVIDRCDYLVLYNKLEPNSEKVGQLINTLQTTGTLTRAWTPNVRAPIITIQWGIHHGANPTHEHCLR